MLKINTERYRSGHNGADSKSVWEQSHAGSNPALSANFPLKSTVFAVLFFFFGDFLAFLFFAANQVFASVLS